MHPLVSVYIVLLQYPGLKDPEALRPFEGLQVQSLQSKDMYVPIVCSRVLLLFKEMGLIRINK